MGADRLTDVELAEMRIRASPSYEATHYEPRVTWARYADDVNALLREIDLLKHERNIARLIAEKKHDLIEKMQESRRSPDCWKTDPNVLSSRIDDVQDLAVATDGRVDRLELAVRRLEALIGATSYLDAQDPPQ